jgi:hypothetical protein
MSDGKENAIASLVHARSGWCSAGRGGCRWGREDPQRAGFSGFASLERGHYLADDLLHVSVAVSAMLVGIRVDLREAAVLCLLLLLNLLSVLLLL